MTTAECIEKIAIVLKKRFPNLTVIEIIKIAGEILGMLPVSTDD